MNTNYHVQLNHRRSIGVESLDEAARALRAVVEAEGYGASDLCREFGEVRDNRGVLVAYVSYNGRILGPEKAPKSLGRKVTPCN